MPKPKPLAVTGDPEADRLLNEDPFALLIGMLLDQQFPMERAFASPHLLKQRLGGTLDPATIAACDPETLADLFKGPPALHRYPGSMAARVQTLAKQVLDEYGGDAAAVWTRAADGADLFKRLKALPGYGDQKAKIFTALLAKRFGIRPEGWEKAAGAYADGTPRSVADIDSPDVLLEVRRFKQAQKQAAKGTS